MLHRIRALAIAARKKVRQFIEMRRVDDDLRVLTATNHDLALTITALLEDAGIDVEGAEGTVGGVEISCDVRPEEVAAYQAAWVEIAGSFAEQLNDRSSNKVVPATPLGRKWARTFGLRCWSEPITTTCLSCYTSDTRFHAFGAGSIASAKTVLPLQDCRTVWTLTYKGGGSRDVFGHVCKSCQRNPELASATKRLDFADRCIAPV